MKAPAIVLETERLVLRRMSVSDAGFILELLNEPSFVRFVGDKGVRTLDDASRYISTGPMASYDRYGFGLYVVMLKEADLPVGICGLLQRASLEDVDIGFAFLPKYWSNGYAAESATAVLAHARRDLGLTRIVAVTTPDNAGSIRLLENLGFRFERTVTLEDGGPEIRLYATQTASGP